MQLSCFLYNEQVIWKMNPGETREVQKPKCLYLYHLLYRSEMATKWNGTKRNAQNECRLNVRNEGRRTHTQHTHFKPPVWNKGFSFRLKLSKYFGGRLIRPCGAVCACAIHLALLLISFSSVHPATSPPSISIVCDSDDWGFRRHFSCVHVFVVRRVSKLQRERATF